ncbi:MAG: TULIP family P47-like protein [Hungatella sp.]|nr:TULIP family P47-like protein [Hungatella sp.]
MAGRLTERAIEEPLQTSIIFKMPQLDEKVKEAVFQPSLYTDAQSVKEKELEEVRLSSPIVTNGWDAVSICRITVLNQVLRDKKIYPKDVEGTFADGATTYGLNAGFLPWQNDNGGGGKMADCQWRKWKKHPDFCCFERGSIKVKGANTGITYSVAGTSMKLPVKLGYCPQPKPAADNGDYELKVKADSDSQEDPIVAIVSFTPPFKLPFIINAVLQEILLSWFNLPEKLTKFNTLFSTVIINNIGKSEDFKWLQPIYMSYACTSLKDSSDGLFGVLCMVRGRDGTENIPSIAPMVKSGTKPIKWPLAVKEEFEISDRSIMALWHFMEPCGHSLLDEIWRAGFFPPSSPVRRQGDNHWVLVCSRNKLLLTEMETVFLLSALRLYSGLI